MAPKRDLSPSPDELAAKRPKAAISSTTGTSGDALAAPVENSWMLPNADTTHNNLLHIMAQYPILEHIVAHLRPRDLVPLAQTCQTAYTSLNLQKASSKSNLLTKTLCPGKGIKIRAIKHNHPHALGFPTFTAFKMCGGFDDESGIESHPCAGCGVNTCDECRMHMVYQSLVEDPGLAPQRWWAGYSVAFPNPVRIFPPKGTKIPSPWDAPLQQYHPMHDQGKIGVYFDANFVAKPEPLARILDFDLGRRLVLEPKHPYNGLLNGKPLLRPFNDLVQHRILRRCPDCFVKAQVTARCHCTLRNRFLDRWICIDCANVETTREVSASGGARATEFSCVCSKTFTWEDFDSYRMICQWCSGEIVDEPEIEEEEDQDQPPDAEAAAEALVQQAMDAATPPGMQALWLYEEQVARRLLEPHFKKKAQASQGDAQGDGGIDG